MSGDSDPKSGSRYLFRSSWVRSNRRVVWGMLAVAFTCAVIAAPFGYRSLRLSQVPEIENVFLPSGRPDFDENAFLYYDSVQLTEEPSSHIAFSSLLEFYGAVGHSKLDEGSSNSDVSESEVDSNADFSSPDAMDNRKAWRAWHVANKSSLKMIRQGADADFAMICYAEDQDYTSMSSVGPHFSLVGLVLLEASHQLSLNDFDAAWRWLRVGFRHSRHVGMYGSHHDRSVGSVFHGMATENMLQWASDKRVSSSSLRQAIRDVRADYRMTPSALESLRIEYFFDANTFDPFVDSLGNQDHNPVADWIEYEPERTWRLVKHVYANWKSQADLPLHQQTRLANSQFRLFVNCGDDSSTDLMNAEVLEQLCQSSRHAAVALKYASSVPRDVYVEQARQRCLEVGLAAHCYFRSHGRFPATRAEFESTPLGPWPFDPMSFEERDLGYQVSDDGASAVVYSVGYNGNDNGGQIDLRPQLRENDLGFRLRVF